MGIEREHGRVFEFGSVRLDPSERLCLRNGQVLPLTPKAFDLLVYLVERHGHLVEKQALMHAIWPDSVVEDANLAYTVSMLRKALDDDADGASVIQTVPTRGYRFVAPVKVSWRMQAESSSDREIGGLGLPHGETLAVQPTRGPLPITEVFRLARWRRAASWIVGGLGIGAVLVLGYSPRWRSTTTPATQRLSSELGTLGRLPATEVPLALSPDGSLLAFVARTTGEAPDLYVRRLDQLAAMPLSGTGGASTPCFSPDGQWLAFFADRKLKKVPVTGGPVVTLADAPEPRGAWWAEDGTIVFAPHNRMGLMRVSSVGGQAQPVTTLTHGEITHRFPQVLPGGVGILYTASTEVIIGTGSTLVVQPLPSGERTIIQRGGYFGRYVGSGHIVYTQDDALFAMPFDLRRLEGDRSGGADDVMASSRTSAAAVRNWPCRRRGRWPTFPAATRSPHARSRGWTAPGRSPRFAPNRPTGTTRNSLQTVRRIAMDIRGAGQSDIWVYDWSRGTHDPRHV